MQVTFGIENLQLTEGTIVTDGTFDGVHLGHCHLLHKMVELGKKLSLKSVMLTYEPHPRYVLGKGTKLKLITTLDEKIAELSKLGIDHLVVVNFTAEFSQISPEDYINDIFIKKLNTKCLVVGYDHRFGKNREGSFEYLKANESNYPFSIVEIPKHIIDELAVSSTKIRNAVETGHIELANRLLNRRYSFTGKVVEGLQLGRKLGFPTANLLVKDGNKLIPGEGVYIARAYWEGEQKFGLLSIGERPVLGGTALTIEAWLLNYSGDLYGKELTIELHRYIRPQMNFQNLDALVDRMKIDRSIAEDYLKNFPE